MTAQRVVAAREYEPCTIPADWLPAPAGFALWRAYDAGTGQLQVTFPSPATGDQWRITSLGWSGALRAAPDLQLLFEPRIPLPALWRMWALAYDLREVAWQPELVRCAALPDLTQELARLLARLTQRRARQGIAYAYMPRFRALPYVRGRVAWTAATPGRSPLLPCHFAELTADIADNQIVAYTLDLLLRSGLCEPQVAVEVAAARRRLAQVTPPTQLTAEACRQRRYTRLTADYRPLHACCHFLLANAGPALVAGQFQSIPFLIDTARLYERFVAAWLRQALPSPWRLSEQQSVRFGRSGELLFTMDLVVMDENQRAVMVLDTKYKEPERPASRDVHQIMAYARAVNCGQAVLVYPSCLAQPLDVQVGRLRLRSLTLAPGPDLDQAGARFMDALLTCLADAVASGGIASLTGPSSGQIEEAS